MSDPLLYRVDDGVARITLNRPEARNALSAALLTALDAAVRRAAADPAVRLLLLAGSGPIFCAGADLKEDRAVARAAPPFADILLAVMTCPKPVLAVVEGPARAGGIGLIAAADISLSVDSATFAFPEAHIGVVPAIISVPCAARMNPRALRRYALTGEVFDACAAVAGGLLSASAPRAELDRLVAAVVDGVRAGAPAALSATRRLLDDVAAMPVDAAFRYTTHLSAAFFDSADAVEGRLAFREKRLPAWRLGAES